MSIAQQDLDYTTLKWVKDEIQESLNQTRQALEAYVDDPNDSTQIRFCATYLHQIYGTLQMVEIYGGALLAEEMELLANAISQGQVSRKEDAYDVLMRAVLQLPAYLEHLENGQQDMPVILLPLLNDLRTARGEPLLSENAFFSPNLSVTPPEDPKKPKKEPVDIQQYAKKLRPVYQAALVRWYRDINTPEALKKLAIVLRELLYNSTTENATRLWWVASGIVEGLSDSGLEASNSVKQLMGHQIDRQIKRIIDEGETAFNNNPPVELLKNLLYYVATSTSQGTRTGQIKMAFSLDQLLPGSVDVNEAFAQLRGSNTDLMQSVSSVIKEDLLHVKDQLDIFVRTKDKPVSDLEPLTEHLNRISDTLAMLGLGDLHKIIQDQNRSVTELAQSGAQPSEISLMEVASALLYVESSLEGLQSTASSSALSAEEKADTLLPPSEQRQLNNLVIGEATKLVAEVKEAFNAYAVDTANRSAIQSTPEKLDQVRGVLSILNLNRAANLLNTSIDYIRHQLLREDIEPNQKALDLVADVITSIEYFLEAVAEDRGHPENILSVAESSAQELGYTPEAIDKLETARAEPAVEPTAIIDIDTEATNIVEPEPSVEAIAEPEPDILDTAETIESLSLETEPAPEETPAVDTPVEEPAPTVATPSTAATSNLPEDDIDEEILEIFLEEADEVVGTMKENLQAWKQNHDDSEALTVLRRSYHTIKGSGRLAGAKVVGEFAWAIENMLNRIIEGRLELQPEIFDLMEKSEATLEASIQHLKGELDTQPNIQSIVDLAEAFANGSYAGEAQPKPDLIDELLGDMGAPAETTETLELEVEENVPAPAIEDEAPTQEIHLEDLPAQLDATPSEATISQNLTLIEIFQRETALHIAAIENYLNSYSDSDLHPVTEPLMRALHTLHGSANMANVENIADLSEHLDRYFATLFDTRQSVNSDAVDVLSQGADLIKDMLQGIEDNDYVSPNTTELVNRIHELHREAREVEAPSEEAMLSIVGGSGLVPQNDGLEDTMEILADRSPDGLEEMVGAGEATSDGLDDTIELADEQTEELSDTLEFASDDVADSFADNIEVEEITLSAEPETISLETSAEPEEEVDEELISIFLDEADEILRNAEALIQGWSGDPNDRSIMEELQRSLHTLKGGARMANLMPIANISHRVESLLEAVTEGTAASSTELPKAVQRCQDWLTHSLETVRSGQTLEEPVELLNLIQTFIDTQPGEEAEQVILESSDATEEIELENALPLEIESTEPALAVEESAEEDDELLIIFLEEASDIQDKNEQLIQEWIADRDNLGPVTEIQRNLHTLKGGARMAHISKVADVAHAMETLLEQVTEQQLTVTDELPSLIQLSHDWIGNAVAKARERAKLPDGFELIGSIEAYIAASAAPSEALATPEPAVSEPIEDETLAFENADTLAFEIEDHLETMDLAGEAAPQAADVAAVDYDEELVDIFLEEAEEIQENIDRILHDWSSDVGNHELIAEVQRSLHTLKGGARMAGIAPVGDLSHAIESLMEAVTEGRLQPTAEFPKVVHACHDWLANAIDSVKQRDALSAPSPLIKQLENLLAGKAAMEGVSDFEAAAIVTPKQQKTPAVEKPEPKPVPETKKPEPVAIETKPKGPLVKLPGFSNKDDSDATLIPNKAEMQTKARTAEEQIRVKADLIDSMVNHAGEVNIYNARIAQQLGQWHFNLNELHGTIERLREQLRNFEMETEAQIMYRHNPDVSAVGEGGAPRAVSTDVSFDPLEMDRFSHMQQLSRSMVESFDDLTNIQGMLESMSGDTDVLLLQQSRINNDLQEELVSTRLTPFSSVIARLRRVVRQTCQETGKQAELQINGAEGEMDRTQLNRIVPALEHILRNAIDHGMEQPADRKRAKKPESGVIAINFSREGSEVVLRISDDGAGINVNAIRKKAIERGIIDRYSKVEDDEVLDFILQSGFSTAEEVTQISGRGVGMDVVNTEIKQLNGSLHIDTELGKGSTFTIRLPLTVLINQALMINVDEAVYAISLSNIEHVIRITSEELNKLIENNASDYEYAGNSYQHLNIGYVLHGSAPTRVPEKGKYPILLARSGDHRVALQVDNLIGRQEIVIKSVGPQLSSINSISGATILPDGEVALILDLSTLIRTSHALQKTDDVSRVLEAAAAAEEEKPTTVLIVDDSITVRKVTQRLLTRHKYESITAKDGMDALTVMLEHIPDIILLDVEMPRMDGYELATAVRSDPRLKHIPIIMITSRTGDKHRDRALNIGVNMYMGKPFQEHELLDNIQSLLHKQ